MKKPSRSRPHRAKSKRPHQAAAVGPAPAAVRLKPVARASVPAPSHPRALGASAEPIRLTGFAAFLEGLNGTPPRRQPRRPVAVAAHAYAADDRQALALLSLPVVALIMALMLTQAMKPGRYGLEIAITPQPPAAAVLRPRDGAIAVVRPARAGAPIPGSQAPFEIAAVPPAPALSLRPASATAAASPIPLAAAVDPASATTSAVAAVPATRPGSPMSPGAPAAIAALKPPVAVATPSGPVSRGASAEVIAAPARAFDLVPAAAGVPQLAAKAPVETQPARPVAAAAAVPYDGPVLAPLSPRLAMLAPAAPAGQTITTARPPLPPVAAREPAADEPNVCTMQPPAGPARLPAQANLLPAAFGLALAAAARDQTRDLVIYNDKYRRIAYPMGDVQPLFGVCTDVVIRAYRALGIDLQQLVHESSVGGGDTSIEHRRTETLRRFFARYGEQLPPSTIAENFRPGDIVTYYRPQNRHSRSHIAIVSDVVAPSGRYMIIHNRGWGPQLEDGLFVDEITGHYRYLGLPAKAAAVAAIAGAAAAPAAGPRGRQTVLASGASAVAGTQRMPICRIGGKASPGGQCSPQAAAARLKADGAPVAGLGR